MIHYVTGDATQPIGKGRKLICHVCNDLGAWGAGFVLALSARWDAPEVEYRNWRECDRKLGRVQFVPVDHGLYVANMVAQHGVTWSAGIAPLRYSALSDCLRDVAGFAVAEGASVHMPRIGCGIAGGHWPTVEAIINKELAGIEVYVYDLPTNQESCAA